MPSTVLPPPLISRDPSPEQMAVEAALFHLANGYIGLRAQAAEAPLPGVTESRGQYLNGFYENVTLEYAEALYGFPRTGERMLNLPEAGRLRISVNGRPLSPFMPGAVEHVHSLHPAEALRRRSYRIKDLVPGIDLIFSLEELVHLTRRELQLQELCLRAEASGTGVPAPAELTVEALLDGEARNFSSEDDPRIGGSSAPLYEITQSAAADGTLSLSLKTPRSGLRAALYQQLSHVCSSSCRSCSVTVDDENPRQPALRWTFTLEAGQEYRLTRLTAFADSRFTDDPEALAESVVLRAREAGTEVLHREQAEAAAAFWQSSRVLTEGDEESQKALDFALFALLQNAPSDGRTLIAAKGLSGEGYEGHYFWDFEIYMFPFYLWVMPERARALLDYRWGLLPRARENARLLGYAQGAQFAWRSITGPECSGYYPSGSAQVHINADIAHAFMSYFEVTGDLAYMAERGAEVLIETARTWLALGFRQGDRFFIHGVTGPDEYTCLVNNNYYTNLAAKHNLEAACRIVRLLKEQGLAGPVLEKTALREEELQAFAEAARDMFLPRDEALGIDAQDDSFLSKPVWPLESTPKSMFPLLLHVHPSTLYRYQVLKQADTTLAHFLFAEDPAAPEITRTRHYYEAITTHDSSLSPCIYGAMAALAGERERAETLYRLTRDIDLKNRQNNTRDGLHLGNLGGTWLFTVQGFAGLRLRQGRLSLWPRLPRGWKRLDFPLRYRGRRLLVSARPASAELLLQEGEPLDLIFCGRELRLEPQKPVRVSCAGGIIFDLDGVLCSTDHLHYEAWKEMADREGIPFDRTINERLRGVDRMASLNIILEKASRPYSEEEKAALAEGKNNRYKELITRLVPEDAAPGAREVLQELRRRGVKPALASSSKNAPLILQRLGLTESFDAVVDGSCIRRAKPDPELFLTACERLGLQPADCLVVEDAEAGLQAAKAAGMSTAGIGPAAASALADIRLEELSELL